MRKQISFTTTVKEEISSQEYDNEKLFIILSAYVQINGRIVFQNQKTAINLQTENAKVAKLIYLAFQKLFAVNPRFTYSRRMKFDKRVNFNIIVEDNSDEILEKLEIDLVRLNQTRSFLRKDDNIRSFLAGAFLASGSISNPSSSNYHLEIASTDQDLIAYLERLISRTKTANFHVKQIKRRNQYLVYLKRAEEIADFLKLINAQISCLDFEDVRLLRDFRNNENRLIICDIANENRAFAASKKQIDDIKLIDKVLGIKNIANIKMRLLCEIRLDNEGVSMLELAEMLGEKLQMKISKSNINHLFRALHELAERYRRSMQ